MKIGRLTSSRFLLICERISRETRRGVVARPLAKQEYERKKPHINVGTIGHVDHGKTSLTSAITKVLALEGKADFRAYDQIDNLSIEKQKGITISATHVEYETEARHYSHIDCPGHIDYIKNMITGAFLMDGAILVLAANSGVMPQTREHLILARQIGLERLVVFINKVDIVDEATVQLCDAEIREMIADHGFDGEGTPVVSGSARCALEETNPDVGHRSIISLLEALDNHIPIPQRSIDSPGLLSISSSYSIPGRGTVVAGILERGLFKKGDQVELLGYEREFKSTVLSLETFHKTVKVAEPGDNIGVLVRGVRRKGLRRGMILCKAGTAKVYNRVVARLFLLGSAEGGLDFPVANDSIFQIFSRTFRLTTNLTILDENREMAMPGEVVDVELMLTRKMHLPVGSRFTLRKEFLTAGFGVVTETLSDADDAALLRRWPKMKMPSRR